MIKNGHTTKIITAFLIILAFVFSTIALSDAASEIQTIEVIGTAPIKNGDVTAAREYAILNGLASAIDQVVSDLLPVDARINNFQAIDMVIYENPKEYITDYKVLAEFADEKRYKVLVSTTISTGIVDKKLSYIGIVAGNKDVPKILFVITEQNIGDIGPGYWWGNNRLTDKSFAEAALSEVFKSKGFRIADHSAGFSSVLTDALADQPYPDNMEAAELGKLLSADVVIVGISSAQRASNTLGTDTYSYNGTLSVRAIRADSGKEIASANKTFVTVSDDDTAGGETALSGAGKIAGELLASKIAADWVQKENLLTTLEITVGGNRYLANFEKFRRVLNSVTDVAESQVEKLRADEAILVVKFKGKAQKFAEALMSETYDAFSINIYEVTADTIRIELITE
ncbi:MAG: hypothetical protein K9L30_03605 [Desulfobacterales bacterium]|nr:hypothetical protein [Desulfobacterales bacterium]